MATKLYVDGVILDELWNTDLSNLKDRCFWKYKNPGNSSSEKVYWDNYCAINLSERLIKNGFLMPSKKNSSYKQCNSHPQDGDNAYHFLLAEQMARWLIGRPVPGLPEIEKSTGEKFEDEFNSRQGIIFFKNYWVDNGHQTGDHIDLWKNGRLPSAPDWQRELLEATTSWMSNISFLQRCKGKTKKSHLSKTKKSHLFNIDLFFKNKKGHGSGEHYSERESIKASRIYGGYKS